MQGWNVKDVAGGLLIGGFGLAFLIGSFQYEFGRVGQIGPGVFPMLVGLVSVVLGAMIVRSAYGKSGKAAQVACPRPGRRTDLDLDIRRRNPVARDHSGRGDRGSDRIVRR